jgi:hypothetical protein
MVYTKKKFVQDFNLSQIIIRYNNLMSSKDSHKMISPFEKPPFFYPSITIIPTEPPCCDTSISIFSRLSQTVRHIFEELYRVTFFLQEPGPRYNPRNEDAAFTHPNDPSQEEISKFLKAHRQVCKKELNISKRLAGCGKNAAREAGLVFMAHLGTLGDEEIRNIPRSCYRQSLLNPNRKYAQALFVHVSLFGVYRDRKGIVRDGTTSYGLEGSEEDGWGIG